MSKKNRNGVGGGYENLRGPTKSDMEKLLAKGHTAQGIADAWFEKTGERVGRTTITMAIQRYGLEPNSPRPRYDDLLPWRVKTKHARRPDVRLLREEAKRRRGLPVEENLRGHLTNWLRELKDSNSVIAYAPNTEEGFFWVPREKADTDIIRREPIV